MAEPAGLVLVGGDSEAFNAYLETDDPCFGQHYTKGATECKACVAPVIVGGRVCLLREVCAARCRGVESPAALVSLTTQDIIRRLEAGASVAEVFREILADADPQLMASAARHLLYRRFRYMRQEFEMETPDIPPTKEMLDVHGDA